ncbi:MAG TPA: enoyl-CoA hydratase-related protein [Dehalococcoidia bacterium]|nr:enoyl-CoA hydratase-related protein [Dehalococcoidia bacterium]
MDFQDILYTKENGIATITLNRPQAMNTFHPNMLSEWTQAIEDAKHDDDVMVIMVTGAGRAFCAGMDVKASAEGRAAENPDLPTGHMWHNLRDTVHQVHRAVMDLPKPYIAAVNGAAAGGGMDLLSLCDIRIASDKARFGMSYVKMAVVPGGGGCYFMPRIVGMAKALELMWTGDFIDAEEALRIGYVSKVVPHDELMPATYEFCEKLVQGPAVAIQLAKRLAYRCTTLTMPEALEAADSAMAIALSTEDAKEGPRAFVEKRVPVFKGR